MPTTPSGSVEQAAPVRLLTLTTLYPHAGRPNHGIFVENRLRHLVSAGEATSTVIAPVPWFPSRSARFGDWGRNAWAEASEMRHGVQIYHPRYLSIPKLGMVSAPAALLIAMIRQLRRLQKTGFDFDVIDAHYLYPDGVAATMLGRLLHKPVVLTARGSDVTQYPDYAVPRRLIRWAMHHAAGLISVSSGLKTAMIELGAAPEKVTVLRNGVDLEQFQPTNSTRAQVLDRKSGPILLSVGHLIARKRHHIAIEALRELPGWRLAIVGDGPEAPALQTLAHQLNLTDRVMFCGAQPHSALPGFYTAADLSILSSSREGWANVLLESMACGTPVIASNIPGNPEVVAAWEAGEVVEQNTASCFAATIRRYFDQRPSPKETRAYAEGFGWEPTTRGQLQLFRNIMANRLGSLTDRTQLA